jgi:hypothetical protein
LEFIARVLASDRQVVRRHIENSIYRDVQRRNTDVLKGAAKLWFPKIVLQGTNYFTDYVLKLRDRGDIPRRWAVEAGGFDYDAALSEREREIKRGDDDILQPAAVPFSDPNAGPQDNNNGRPQGTSPNNGAPGAQRRTTPPPRGRVITRNAGETVRAFWNEEEETSYRAGEITNRILDEYHDTAEVGRITQQERDALAAEVPTRVGNLAVIPVNAEHAVVDHRVIRLTTGASMIVGERADGAIVAKALVFREPEFDLLDAEETALRWGYSIEGWDVEPAREEPPKPEEEHASVANPAGGLTLIINTADGRAVTKRVETDPETGRIIAVHEEPVNADA